MSGRGLKESWYHAYLIVTPLPGILWKRLTMPSSATTEDSLGVIGAWHLQIDSQQDQDIDLTPLAVIEPVASVEPAAPVDQEAESSDFTIVPNLGQRDFDATMDHFESTTGPVICTASKPEEGYVSEEIADPDRPVVFPKLGEIVGGFRLQSELGRGAFARVYLAEQVTLGDRLVALKVSKAEGDEPENLARLQHTHIVPIHSVSDDPQTGLRLLCMPYYGGANLAQVLSEAGTRIAHHPTGRTFVDALDNAGGLATLQPPSYPSSGGHAVSAGFASGRLRGLSASLIRRDSILRPIATLKALWTRRPTSLSDRLSEFHSPRRIRREHDDRLQPARQILRKSSYVRASAWIIARLAEGLDHAHSRGILHRDLKPSNILIAADGTPMLLDFNLSTDVKATSDEDGAKAMLGGTLPYMAPEHLDAFNPRGATPASAVNEQSDVYALGLILFEMAVGRLPFTGPTPGIPLFEILKCLTAERLQQPPSPRAFNPEISWSLDAIIRKCLEPSAAKRYTTAGEFAEDLRRFLADHPNRHAPEPSPRERLAKFLRRNPRFATGAMISSVAMVFILMLASLLAFSTTKRASVESRLMLKAFQADFPKCQFLLNTVSGPIDHLPDGLALSKTTLLRFGVSTDGPWHGNASFQAFTTDETTKLKADLAELVMLDVRARVTLASRVGQEDDRRHALETGIRRLDHTEAHDPAPPAALYVDRARYKAALGLSAEATADRVKAAATKIESCRDFYLMGTSLLSQGKFDEAEPLLSKATAMESNRFWAWFGLGYCYFEQGRFLESSGAFGTCTVITPEFAWSYLNRGQALSRAGKIQDALNLYDKALERDPKFVEALVNRGLVRIALNQDLEGAITDLEAAVAQGRTEPMILAVLGGALSRQGRQTRAESLYHDLLTLHPEDPNLLCARGFLHLEQNPNSARADFEHVLKIYPQYARAHLGIARILKKREPSKAIEHASLALQTDPNLIDALELRALIKARMGDISAMVDVDLLVQSPTPVRLYNAACVMALLTKTHPNADLRPRAKALLDRAIRQGFPAAQAQADPDLEALRD